MESADVRRVDLISEHYMYSIIYKQRRPIVYAVYAEDVYIRCEQFLAKTRKMSINNCANSAKLECKCSSPCHAPLPAMHLSKGRSQSFEKGGGTLLTTVRA